jgi:hypothetical protein
MKNLMILLMAFVVVSCANDQNKDNKVNGGETVDMTNPEGMPTPPADVQQVNVLPDANGVVFHYVCADKCEGGAANEQTNCPVCGKLMAHNQGFHANDKPGEQININDLGNVTDISANPGGAQIAPPPAAEPAQNAKGVWHYTCAKGCAGGSGTAEACKKCGATLAHNAAYHN